jgi:hypothetical protein
VNIRILTSKRIKSAKTIEMEPAYLRSQTGSFLLIQQKKRECRGTVLKSKSFSLNLNNRKEAFVDSLIEVYLV